MVLQGIVENGVVRLPADASLPDGTIVRVEANPRTRFSDLMDLAGTWQGDDAEHVVEEIYASRSSAPTRASLDR